MKVSVTALGGVGEIGMNMYIYETESSALIVDCGVKFAGASEPGVDLIIPDFSYLETIKNKLTCVVVSHAHEDHTGALPFLLSKYPLPLAAGKFSMDLIDYKLKEKDISVEKTYLEESVPFIAGDFSVSFIPISHSIPGTGALFIRAGDSLTVLHMSDYKVDFSPVSGAYFRAAPFLEIGDAGLDCLVADSTNSLTGGFTNGEKKVALGLERIFNETDGRIFFTTFASNSERIGSVITLAEKFGRKIALEGSSLLKNIETARRNGLLKIAPDTIVPRKQIERLQPSEICVIATGSQGEETSVISKISKSEYSNILIRESDVFIFSSRIIPGNEQNIITVMNNIAFLGGKCVSIATDDDVHASGHASEEDMKMLLKLVRPKYLIPVHGEYIHLRRHKEIAIDCGMPENNIILMKRGAKTNFNDGELGSVEDVECGKNFVDSRGGFILNAQDLQNRKRLAFEGGVFVYAEPNMEKGVLEKDPIITTLGFSLDERDMGNISSFLKVASDMQLFERFSPAGWRDFITKTIKKYFKKNMGRRPMTSVVIGELK